MKPLKAQTHFVGKIKQPLIFLRISVWFCSLCQVHLRRHVQHTNCPVLKITLTRFKPLALMTSTVCP
ncbi:UNVERIFIED_CONTAM: hypothetical protein GTU68_052869 [Idotea baltica]|nr:hypothetical protein [Idotea baltica]